MSRDSVRSARAVCSGARKSRSRWKLPAAAGVSAFTVRLNQSVHIEEEESLQLLPSLRLRSLNRRPSPAKSPLERNRTARNWPWSSRGDLDE